MSKYKDLIQQAKNTDNQKDGFLENHETKKEDKSKEPEVNLCIKVEKRLRQHWAAEAKRQGTTLKAIISKALEDKLGLPD